MDEIECAVSCCLGTQYRTAPFHTFTREDTLELVGELLILSEEVADLTAAYADVAGGHVLIGSDISVKLLHEGLAETHHLSVRTSADGEVGTALSTTHRQCGERILEGLLEAEEFHDT